jgi:hypothetical protein
MPTEIHLSSSALIVPAAHAPDGAAATPSITPITAHTASTVFLTLPEAILIATALLMQRT